MKKQF